MKIGRVGYGTGGRPFDAPFLAAAEAVELAGVAALESAATGRSVDVASA